MIMSSFLPEIKDNHDKMNITKLLIEKQIVRSHRFDFTYRQRHENMTYLQHHHSISEVKSIWVQSSIQLSSSVDRDIDRLLSLKLEENSFCPSDDDYLSDQSTTDSYVDSLSSNDISYHSITEHYLDTLV
jgi:hypothetical protein